MVHDSLKKGVDLMGKRLTIQDLFGDLLSEEGVTDDISSRLTKSLQEINFGFRISFQTLYEKIGMVIDGRRLRLNLFVDEKRGQESSFSLPLFMLRHRETARHEVREEQEIYQLLV